MKGMPVGSGAARVALGVAMFLSAGSCASCSPCGSSAQSCCGAGVCNAPLVCVAGNCAENTPSTPKTADQVCRFLAQGQARQQALARLSAQVPLFSAALSVQCPASAAQVAAVQTFEQQLVAEVASPPTQAGCDDPHSQLSQRAARVAAALDAGRVVWNAPAEAECQAGMQASGFLAEAVLSTDGGFTGRDQVFGTSGDPGTAPCDEILQGRLAVGEACQDGTECQPGLYCQPASADGCGGICAIPDGGCGPLELCAGQSQSYVSLGGGLQKSLYPGSPCDAGVSCGPCLVCVDDRCATPPGGLGQRCPLEGCLPPFLFCGDGGTCQPNHLLGEPCEPEDGACLQGSCLGAPPTCRLPGGVGDPCSLDGAFRISSCDAGVCAPDADGGASCQPFPSEGQACLQLQCAPGDACDPASLLCRPLGQTGEACQQDGQCVSGLCVIPDGGPGDAGVCLSPCIQPPDEGCLNLHSSSSFLLGLGGAAVLARRRRRKLFPRRV